MPYSAAEWRDQYDKKEILEIRKQFSPENCAITRICGCYVDGDKEKKMEFKEAFLSLPEEESFKYFDIFKKALSGTIGKNLSTWNSPWTGAYRRYTGVIASPERKQITG